VITLHIATTFQIHHTVSQQEDPRKLGGIEIGTYQLPVYADVSLLGENINTIKKNSKTLLYL
jgi:hypothetical protein